MARLRPLPPLLEHRPRSGVGLVVRFKYRELNMTPKRSSSAERQPSNQPRDREKPAGQESGAEFRDDPKSGPDAGRRGGESRAEEASPADETNWNGT
jgi:general stress protein YciG